MTPIKHTKRQIHHYTVSEVGSWWHSHDSRKFYLQKYDKQFCTFNWCHCYTSAKTTAFL